MPDIGVAVFARVLTAMFVVGMAGCVIVIPYVAFGLFSVLFEPDTDEEASSEVSSLPSRTL